MKIAYLDCSNGISGDMLLAALLDAGLEVEKLKKELAMLPVSGYSVKLEKIKSQRLMTSRLRVFVKKRQPFRNLERIMAILEKSGLKKKVKEKAKKIFRRLGTAEANVHGVKINAVHFHEIGAVDTLVDIVGTVWAMEQLKIKKMYSSPLNMGSGLVRTAHGLLPVPAPATAELLKGIPVYGSSVKQELVTPTGAVLVSSLCQGYQPLPKMRVERIGMSSGTKEANGHVNLFRVFIGEK